MHIASKDIGLCVSYHTNNELSFTFVSEIYFEIYYSLMTIATV